MWARTWSVLQAEAACCQMLAAASIFRSKDSILAAGRFSSGRARRSADEKPLLGPAGRVRSLPAGGRRSDGPRGVDGRFGEQFLGFDQAQEFEADAVDLGFPTGFQEIAREPGGAPGGVAVGPLDQHAPEGGRAAAGLQDADAIIGQADAAERR